MDSVTILLTGAGAPGAPSIIKCLRNNGERKLRIIGVDINPNASSRDVVDVFYVVPKASDEHFIDEIFSVCIKENVKIVIPIVTRELEKFSLAKEKFHEKGILVSVMEHNVLRIMNDKFLLAETMQQCGLPTPAFCSANSLEDVISGFKKLGHPKKGVCIKIRNGNGSRGIRIVDNRKSQIDLFLYEKPNSMYVSYNELLNILKDANKFPNLLLMDVLDGVEFSIDIIADKGNILFLAIRKASLVQASITLESVTCKNSELEQQCIKIVKKLQLDGNFGFDLKCDADGNPYIIECNPRLTATVALNAVAGINFPYLGIKKLLGEELPVCEFKTGVKMVRRYNEIFWDADGNTLPW